MVDAVKEYAGVDFATINSDEEAQAIAKEKHLEFSKPLNTVTKGEVLNMLYEEFCEEHITNFHYRLSSRNFTSYKEKERK